MRKLQLLTMLTFAALVSSGCYVRARVPDAYVETAPPAPRVEVYGTAPGPDYFWIGGHYQWSGGQYAWRQGYWEHRRPGHAYVPGYWQRGPRGHVWVEGRWR
ncbi:MAG: hypothetical protein QM723_03740 [Myxococcaceae bacterium]